MLDFAKEYPVYGSEKTEAEPESVGSSVDHIGA